MTISDDLLLLHELVSVDNPDVAASDLVEDVQSVVAPA